MGGGDHHDHGYRPKGHHYFKEVWSPSGGWWCDPKGWRRNTAVAVGAMLFVDYLIFKYTAPLEKRYMKPKVWVPSMLWVKEWPEDPSAAAAAAEERAG